MAYMFQAYDEEESSQSVAVPVVIKRLAPPTSESENLRTWGWLGLVASACLLATPVAAIDLITVPLSLVLLYLSALTRQIQDQIHLEAQAKRSGCAFFFWLLLAGVFLLLVLGTAGGGAYMFGKATGRL